MTCQRCGAEYGNTTDEMRENNLCIHCVMEWYRSDRSLDLKDFSKTRRGSHFKL